VTLKDEIIKAAFPTNGTEPPSCREIGRRLGCGHQYAARVVRAERLRRAIRHLLAVVLAAGKPVAEFTAAELDAMDYLDALATEGDDDE
jgi:hypothetical protein